ncbi:MAG: YgjV family protein [Clostridia bacterium]|nr:YgjV family protein [Clostridia bacterium]
MTTGVILGNCISLAAAFFTARASWVKDSYGIYMNQVFQCLLLALASVFFDSYAGIVTLIACAARNWLAAKDKLTKPLMLLLAVWMAVLGAALNNRGAVGWIVVVANVLYTLGMYFAKKERAIKANIILNLVLWIVYECCITDIPSAVADAVALVIAIASLMRKNGGEDTAIS